VKQLGYGFVARQHVWLTGQPALVVGEQVPTVPMHCWLAG
jgi:hypothetical protein